MALNYIKKIVLIDPPAIGLSDPSAYPPTGLMYLAAVLEQYKYKVEIADFSSYSPTKAIREAKNLTGDLAGITIMSPGTLNVALKIAKNCVNFLEVAVGGAFPTSAPNEIPKYVDWTIRGEGEYKLLNLLKGQIGLSSIDIDDLPLPARHLVKRERIQYKGNVHLSDGYSTTLFISRGCNFNCAFCDVELWGKKYRIRSPKNVAKEIEFLKKEYQITNIRFPDDSFTINKNWVREMCGYLKDLNVTWVALSRTDGVDEELLRLMKDSGCNGLFFGIESGDQRILDKMNKKITVKKNLNTLKLCRKVGLISSAYMIFGFPGEDKQSVEATKKFLQEAQPNRSHFSTFLPLPGSDVWKNPDNYSLKIKDNYYDYWYYDNHDFAFEPLWIDEKELYKLRDDMTSFFQKKEYNKWDGK